MKTRIALYCGVPPQCDRCKNHAKAEIELTENTVKLCDECLVKVVERGLGQPNDIHSYSGTVCDTFVASLEVKNHRG